MNSIIWKGVSSTTIQGLLISELPPITKPEMRTKETVIDGRDGSIIEELGYASYVKTVTIGLYGNFDINQIIKYFTGEGDIVFSNEPDKVYKVKICSKIDYTRLLRYRQASIPFLVQPFKYKLNELYKETQAETVSGTRVVITKNTEDKANAFKIYGKSTQDRTPTPSTPVEIVSLCEDGTMAVTVNGEAFDLAVANKLKGIPVTNKSLATYTDASGQMWCADEIDLARGVYVQRIQKFAGAEIRIGNKNTVGDKSSRFNFWLTSTAKIGNGLAMSSHFMKSPSWLYHDGEYEAVTTNPTAGLVSFFTTSMKDYTIEEFKKFLVDQNVVIMFVLADPIITPLSAEDVSAFAKLLTNEPTITITNDENAHMSVGYIKPFEVFNEGLENSKPLMVLKGSGTVEISVNGTAIFSYTFPDGENEVYIDSEKEDAYLGNVLKNRNMNGEFPRLNPQANQIGWSGNIESISILPKSRWL